MGIPSRLSPEGVFWTLHVARRHRRPAVRAVALYLKENPPAPTAPPPAHPVSRRSFSALFIGAVLVLIHLLILPGYEHRVFVETFGADAAGILNGQLYRCVTALLMHADWVHLLGNLAAMGLFGTVVAAYYGWGVGWALILAGGAAGNLITALWYGSGHLAVGASTAVFAALGLCTVLNIRLRPPGDRRSWRSWLPMAGGLALLGFLGTSSRSDLAGHLFGFLAGVLLGRISVSRIGGCGGAVQLAAACTAAGMVAGCWMWGLRYSG
jgi:membrane associated rhomboid family serine protease